MQWPKDTKRVIRSRLSRRIDNKMVKRTNNDLQNTTQKTNEPLKKPGKISVAPEG